MLNLSLEISSGELESILETIGMVLIMG